MSLVISLLRYVTELRTSNLSIIESCYLSAYSSYKGSGIRHLYKDTQKTQWHTYKRAASILLTYHSINTSLYHYMCLSSLTFHLSHITIPVTAGISASVFRLEIVPILDYIYIYILHPKVSLIRSYIPNQIIPCRCRAPPTSTVKCFSRTPLYGYSQ